MATKLQTVNEALEGRGCLGKAEADEPIFVLRAQDIHAADLVEKWAIWNTTSAPDKAKEARQIADDMRAWPTKKQPD